MIYRKKTFTGVYLNWTSLTARRYKVGLINFLAEQAWKICRDENDRAAELEKIKHILQRNEYPLDVIEKAIKLLCLFYLDYFNWRWSLRWPKRLIKWLIPLVVFVLNFSS